MKPARAVGAQILVAFALSWVGCGGDATILEPDAGPTDGARMDVSTDRTSPDGATRDTGADGTTDGTVSTDSGVDGMPAADGGADSSSGDTGSGMDAGQDSGVGQDSGGGQDSGVAQDSAVVPDTGVDAGLPPPGTLLQGGQFLTLWTVTSDGYAMYTDGTGTLWAQSVTGGARQLVTTVTGPTFIVASGKVVFIWTNIPSTSVTPFAIWTAASGYKTASAASFAGVAAASPDGSLVLFSSNVVASGASGDLVASPTDLSAPTVVASGISLNDASGCFPELAFNGTLALAARCTAGTDAGGTGATISSFSGPSFTRTDLVTNARIAPVQFATDSGGTILFTVDVGARGIVVPLAGGSPTVLDTSVFLGYLFGDGSAVVYGTYFGDLRRSPTSASMPTVLVPSGIGGFFLGSPLSPANNALYLFVNQAPTGLTDLYLANTTTPAPLTTLTTSTTATLPPEPYTKDGTQALWFSPVDTTTFLSTLNATAIATGVSTPLGTAVYTDFALYAAKVAYNDNATGTSFASQADIEVVDLATGTVPTRVVTQADVSYRPAPGGTALVYTYSVSPVFAGLYVVPVP